jgi:hypothetical protein
VAGACVCGNEHKFHKMEGIYCLAEDLLPSQEGLCSMNLVS